jgi:hypothetical protein
MSEKPWADFVTRKDVIEMYTYQAYLTIFCTRMAQDDQEDRIRRAQLARHEARATIDEQTSTLADIDEKAIQIFRVNLILAGVLVSGVSIAVQSDSASAATLLNSFTRFGAVLLFVSTVLAAVTYTSSREEIRDQR